jgi:glycosyltransferase involved in cell wall biosynthesis
LIDAFAQAFGDRPDVRLRIGGDGELHDSLAAQIRTLHLEDRVQLLGRLDRAAVVAELDACDALVLPSHIETFGVVLIEALARGRPVLATRCGGPESFVTPQDGELVARDDRDALAAGMTRLIARRNAFTPEELRARAIERFGPDALVARLEALYAAALGTTPNTRDLPAPSHA